MTSMDTSEDSCTELPIVSSQESNSGLGISIHPLVLLNISDHHTRIKLQTQSEKVNICGAILAEQSGRDIDIINSFEVPLDYTTMTIDQDYLVTKLDQLKQVFPHLDFIGWYSTGIAPTERDMKIHCQFLEKCESSLFLQLDSRAISGENPNTLPVQMYESIYDMSQETPRLVFVKNLYKIETNEAERIAVDHVAKPDMSSHDSSLGGSLGAYLTTQKNAAIMLHSRLQFLQKFLQDTKDGVVPVDHAILRQISSICTRSPVIDPSAFDDQFTKEYDDVLLMGYLGSITKGINTVDDLVDKFNLTYGATILPKTQTPASSHRKGRRSHVA